MVPRRHSCVLPTRLSLHLRTAQSFMPTYRWTAFLVSVFIALPPLTLPPTDAPTATPPP